MIAKDSWGVFCSGLCLIHCIATPLLIASGSLGALVMLISSEWVHKLLLLPVFLFAVFRFPVAYRQHRHHMPGLLAAGGMAGLIIAITYGHGAGGHYVETLLTVIAASILMFAHWWNRRLRLSLLSS